MSYRARGAGPTNRPERCEGVGGVARNLSIPPIRMSFPAGARFLTSANPSPSSRISRPSSRPLVPLDRVVRPRRPLPIGARQIDRGAAEGVTPFDDRPVEVRVRGRYPMQAAQLAHLSHRLLVDVADAVPEKVAGCRLHEQSALADPEPRPRVDAPKGLLALDLAQAVPVSARFHLFERCPLLPSPADVLALVVADQATFGRSRTQSVLHSAGLADVTFQPLCRSLNGV